MIKDNGTGQFLTELSVEQNLTFGYATQIFAEKEVKFGDGQKQSLRLLRTDGRYSNLALMLSDQNPYTNRIQILYLYRHPDMMSVLIHRHEQWQTVGMFFLWMQSLFAESLQDAPEQTTRQLFR